MDVHQDNGDAKFDALLAAFRVCYDFCCSMVLEVLHSQAQTLSSRVGGLWASQLAVNFHKEAQVSRLAASTILCGCFPRGRQSILAGVVGWTWFWQSKLLGGAGFYSLFLFDFLLGEWSYDAHLDPVACVADIVSSHRPALVVKLYCSEEQCMRGWDRVMGFGYLG